MSEQLTQSSTALGIFASAESFQVAMNGAEVIAQSTMIPDAYKGNAGSCLIAINTGNRLGIDFLTVMQNLQVIKGKPSWSGAFVRALLNISGKYKDTWYEWKDPENRIGCRMVGIENVTGRQVEGAWITPQLVKAENWGPKWNTMPEQMYMYRAAAFFARAHAPEAIYGLQTTEEVEDMDYAGGKDPRKERKNPPLFGKKKEETRTEKKPEDLLNDAKVVADDSQQTDTDPAPDNESQETPGELPKEVTDLLARARDEGYTEEELTEFCRRSMKDTLNKDTAQKIMEDWETAKGLINARIRKGSK